MQVIEAIDTVVIGAGTIGIAVAYYLSMRHGISRVIVLDPGDPMALTSAQSGENYRNWWPHPVMTAYTDHAIDLLEEIARDSGNRIHMTRRGYVLATRRTARDQLIAGLHQGYGAAGDNRIRMHAGAAAAGYTPATDAWETAPDGVDVLMGRDLVAAHFPNLAAEIETIVHIRRAGDISGQQLGQFMLERMRTAGVTLRRAAVKGIDKAGHFTLHLDGPDGPGLLHADRVVNAAGPFFAQIGAMLGEALPVRCVFQQKIAFEDRAGAIPRDLPFTIDLDGQELAWSAEERDILASDPQGARLLLPMPGGIHQRPDGGATGRWVKLGWAYNETTSDPAGEAPIDPHFPDIVLRAAGRLNPALACYLGKLPRNARHYGGYYTMTEENWPLIGPMRTPGAFMAGALSGFGTMAATATGALCAAWVAGAERPGYAPNFTLARYDDTALMAELRQGTSRGVL